MNMFGVGDGERDTNLDEISTYNQPDDLWCAIQAELPALIKALPRERPASLQFPECTVGEVCAALVRDGCVIIRNAVPGATCEAIIDEMRPYCEAYRSTQDGNQAKRVGCVLSRSDHSWGLAAHPFVLEVLDGVLGRQVTMHDKTAMQEQLVRASYHVKRIAQHPYQLDITQVIAVAPGGRPQSMHQDSGKHLFDFRGMLEPSVGTIWALRDYTATNGATRCVPGSHLWRKNRVPDFEETVPAVMPAGSCFLFQAGCWHGGGPNDSKDTRWALNIDYSLAWLRQEENQYLANPVEHARRMPPVLQRLIGYSQAGSSLGYYDNGVQPRHALAADAKRIDWAREPEAPKKEESPVSERVERLVRSQQRFS
jgi:ectoine hydroxylase-related dioxygenase (phytanoyl-CoA dioxygenase family)